MTDLRDAIAQAIMADRRRENPQLSQFSGTISARLLDDLVGLVEQSGAQWIRADVRARALAEAKRSIEALPSEAVGAIEPWRYVARADALSALAALGDEA